MRSVRTALIVLGIVCLGPVPSLAKCPGPGCPAGSTHRGLVGAIGAGILLHLPRDADGRIKRSASSATASRKQARQLQTALVHFGFDAGKPDGVFGPKTRAAVAAYQEFIGADPTGVLTSAQKYRLVRAYAADRRDAGDGDVVLALAEDRRARLLQADGQNVPTTTASFDPDREMPPLSLPLVGDGRSFQGACADPAPDDPYLDRFCLLRTHAMARGAQLQALLSGISVAEIERQCARVGEVVPAMTNATAGVADHISRLGGLIRQSGQSPEQLQATMEICLGVGFRNEDRDIVDRSAQMLVALEQDGYAEISGVMAIIGFGQSPDRALGDAWLCRAAGAKAGVAGVEPMTAACADMPAETAN